MIRTQVWPLNFEYCLHFSFQHAAEFSLLSFQGELLQPEELMGFFRTILPDEVVLGLAKGGLRTCKSW